MLVNRSLGLFLKGTVQWELRWVKIGINRSIMIYSFAGKCHLPCPKGHHHESFINFVSGIITFDAIPTCWVSKDNSVWLIWLQHRCIPKCVVKTPAGIITASVLRRCNCAASMSPKMLPRSEKLVWRIFVFMLFRAFFFVSSLFPLA